MTPKASTSLRLACFLAVTALALGAPFGRTFAAESVDPHAVPLLRGKLKPGVYGVGFKAVFANDKSRTWRITRSYDGKFSPDLTGRPGQVDVWYPARPDRGPRMTFSDYMAPSAPAAFSMLQTFMVQRSRAETASSVAPGQLPQLLAQPMAASRKAAPAEGRFPVVFYFGGLNASVESNCVLGEYLASRGYIFVAISLIGVSDQNPLQSTDPNGLETTVRDMEYVASVLPNYVQADMSKIAVMGHSIGGIEAMIFAARQGNVSAVIGLDGTYGFRGSAGLLESAHGYSPLNVRAAVLDARRPQNEQMADIDLSALEAMRYANRTLISVKHVHHSDFTTFAMVGEMYQTAMDPSYSGTGWNRHTGAAGYETVAETTSAFLDARLKDNGNAWAKVTGHGASDVRHLAARKVPPTPLEMAGYAAQYGLEGAKALALESCTREAMADCINPGDYNSLGYSFLGQGQASNGLIIFQLAAWAYPLSANAQDSLADGYFAVNDVDNAKKAIQQAIKLAPTDPGLKDADRAGFITAEKARLD